MLGYAEYGDPDGKPIFFFHGMSGGSRLDARHLHKAALLNNYRLISIDRPGIGLSLPEKKRSILSWGNDVQEFADLLNIKKFSIISHSGGAPFAAACAYKIPDRLNGVAIVSDIAPFSILDATADLSGSQRFLNKAINLMSWLANLIIRVTRIMFKSTRMLKYGMKQMPKVDQIALQSQASDEICPGY